MDTHLPDQCIYLTLCILVKILLDNLLKYFSYFFPEHRIWHFMKIISFGNVESYLFVKKIRKKKMSVCHVLDLAII